MIAAADRQHCLELIDAALKDGAGLAAACKKMGITERTYFRWKKMLKESGCLSDLRTTAKHPEPKNKLSPEERDKILEIANSTEFADNLPHKLCRP